MYDKIYEFFTGQTKLSVLSRCPAVRRAAVYTVFIYPLICEATATDHLVLMYNKKCMEWSPTSGVFQSYIDSELRKGGIIGENNRGKLIRSLEEILVLTN